MDFAKCFLNPSKQYVKEQIPVVSKKEAEARENLMLLGGMIIGLAAGVVIGAGVAALTAPKSGAETRKDIVDKKNSAVSGVKEASDKAVDKMKSAANTVAEKVKDKFMEDEEVVVEYTIHYDDEDEATIEPCCCEEKEEAEETEFCCPEQAAGTCCCGEVPAEESPAEE